MCCSYLLISKRKFSLILWIKPTQSLSERFFTLVHSIIVMLCKASFGAMDLHAQNRRSLIALLHFQIYEEPIYALILQPSVESR